jgi:hypothetical protein
MAVSNSRSSPPAMRKRLRRWMPMPSHVMPSITTISIITSSAASSDITDKDSVQKNSRCNAHRAGYW